MRLCSFLLFAFEIGLDDDISPFLLALLVEQVANRHPDCLIGTADNTRTVMFPHDVEKMDELLGKLVSVRITDFVSPHMVKGELIEVLA